MVKFFKSNPTHPTRALQIWQILIAKASNRQTLTYGMLAQLLGFKGAGVLAPILGHIMFYCQQNNLPPLTVIVVNQKTGLPGKGLTDADLNADRETVFNYDWFDLYPPSPEELASAYEVGNKHLQSAASG